MQLIPLLLQIKSIPRYEFLDISCIVLALCFHMGIVFPGNFHGLLEGALHLQAEPVSYAVGEKLAGNKKKENGGDQRQNQKGNDQLDLKLGPDDFTFTFIIKFDQVPDDQRDQEE